MKSKNSNKNKIIIVLIFLFLTLVTWPILQIQTKELTSLPSYNNEINITTAVWNKGGDITSISIITPMVCISANVDNNITCKHLGYDEYVDCTNVQICNKLNAGKLSNEDKLILKLPNNKPSNFSIKISAIGKLSLVPITWNKNTYFCEKTKNEKYDCTIN